MNIIKIANEIFLSYLRTQSQLIYKQIVYGKKLFNQLNNYFAANNQLNSYFVQKNINIDLSKIDKQYKNKKLITVTLILFDVDKIDEKDYINGVMKPQYGAGQGQALEHNGKNYIVIYGSQKDELWSKKFFLDLFVHQLMHIFDKYIDKEYYNDDYYGHPIQQDKSEENNYGIPYPGMYGDDDDPFDEKFAQYYTCKSQRKELIYSLIASIETYVQQNNFDQKRTTKFINTIINNLQNKQNFLQFIDKISNESNFDYYAFAFIYHLAFSQHQNGNKSDAIKILNDISEYIKNFIKFE